MQLFSVFDKKTNTQTILTSRFENKYVVGINEIQQILFVLQQQNYKIDRDFQYYSNCYFDTQALDFYLMHHNQKPARQKIRLRTYNTSHSFLEIKTRNNKGISEKQRMPTTSIDALSKVDLYFIENNINVNQELFPSLYCNYNRISLVDEAGLQKITIDFNLLYQHNGTEKSIENIVIIEVKQQQLTSSFFEQQLKLLGYQKKAFSKYAVGVCLTRPIKSNNFKALLSEII